MVVVVHNKSIKPLEISYYVGITKQLIECNVPKKNK